MSPKVLLPEIYLWPTIAIVTLTFGEHKGELSKNSTFDECEEFLASRDGIVGDTGTYSEDLSLWDIWLAKLEQDQRDALMDLRSPEAVAILANAPLPLSGSDGDLAGFLSDLYDGVC